MLCRTVIHITYLASKGALKSLAFTLTLTLIISARTINNIYVLSNDYKITIQGVSNFHNWK